MKDANLDEIPKFVTNQQIEQRLPWVQESPATQGQVKLIVVRPDTDQRRVVSQAQFSSEGGVDGDNWQQDCWKKLADGRPDPEVQVAIINARMIEVLAGDQKCWPLAGDQLYVDLDLSVDNLAIGQRLQVGEVALEITAEPHRACKKFQHRFGKDAATFVNSPQGDALRLRGVYARIIQAGVVETGDVISKC